MNQGAWCEVLVICLKCSVHRLTRDSKSLFHDLDIFSSSSTSSFL